VLPGQGLWLPPPWGAHGLSGSVLGTHRLPSQSGLPWVPLKHSKGVKGGKARLPGADSSTRVQLYQHEDREHHQGLVPRGTGSPRPSSWGVRGQEHTAHLPLVQPPRGGPASPGRCTEDTMAPGTHGHGALPRGGGGQGWAARPIAARTPGSSAGWHRGLKDYAPGLGGRPAPGRREGRGGRGAPARLCPPARPWHHCGPARRAVSPPGPGCPGLSPVGACTQHPISLPLCGGTHLSARGSGVTFVSLTRRERSERDAAPSTRPRMMLPDLAGRSHGGTAQGPSGAQLLTFLPSSPGVPSSPWGHKLPVSTQLDHLGTGTAWDGNGQQGHGSERGGSLPHSPLAFVLYWDHQPSGPPGEPQSQAPLPVLTFLPLRPGLPSSPGLPWEEAEAVRESPPAQATRGPRVPPQPQGAGKGELGAGRALADRPSWDRPQRALGRMHPRGAERLVLTGMPGGPRGPVGPGGPCSPRSPGSPCRERRRGSTGQQGTRPPQLAPRQGRWHPAGDRGRSCCAAPDEEAWDRTSAPCKRDGPGHGGTYVPARVPLLPWVPLQTRRR